MQLFDPFGDSFLEDPYPHFARHVRDQPVFYAEDLGYWVISLPCRLPSCAAGVRHVLRQQRPCTGDGAVSSSPSGAGRRGVPFDPDDHRCRSAGPRAHALRIARRPRSRRGVFAQMEPVVRQLVPPTTSVGTSSSAVPTSWPS